MARVASVRNCCYQRSKHCLLYPGDIFCNQYQTHDTSCTTCRISRMMWKIRLHFLSKPKIIFCLSRYVEQSVMWSLVRTKTRQCQQNSNGYWMVKELLPIFHFIYKSGKLTTAPKRVPKHKIWKLQYKSNFSNFHSLLYYSMTSSVRIGNTRAAARIKVVNGDFCH